MNFFKSILAKILIPVIVMTTILVALSVAISMYTFSQFADEILGKEIHVFSRSFDRDIVMLRDVAIDQVSGIAQSARMVATLSEGTSASEETHNEIRDFIENFQSAQRCTFFTILDRDGNVVFRTNSPADYKDSQMHLRSVNEALTQRKFGVSFESTTNSPLSIRAAAPVFDENGTVVGVVTGGFRLDTNEWVDSMQELYGIECTVFIGDTRIATTVRRAGTDERATGTPLNNPRIENRVFDEKMPYYGEAVVLGQPMQAVYKPIRDEGSDEVVGMFFIGLSQQYQMDMMRASMWYNLLVAFIGLLVFAAIVVWRVRAIVVPIRETAEGTKHIAETGDLTFEIPSAFLERKDEVGDLTRAVNMMLLEFRDVAKMAKELATGNWQNDIKIRGDLDLMNKDLSTMLGQVNHALREIDENVRHVATSSGEVASAAQSLSDGSQKAAASIEEITASMSEISSQTKANASGAGQAHDLAQKASKAATEGQGAMQQMTDAMGRITQNSNEIQRVIKVIDDIAFQTNLLALNAAVEAARAGQHGKGFAVVAEEVRNLAARSAKAAQETSELIAKSGHEIEGGGKVASHTAEVLNTIVEQIKQTTDLVSSIATASNEQAQGVNQITIGLQQIDSVTQQNTAAAEESASAANEMTGMAANLQKLIAQFKLR